MSSGGGFETDSWPRLELLEKHVVRQSPSRIEELIQIFAQATKVCLLLRAYQGPTLSSFQELHEDED